MRALVISGGGSKGAFAGGVAQYLIQDKKRVYDLYIGSSTGSLMLSHLALGKINALKRIYSNVDQNSIFSSCPFRIRHYKGEQIISIDHLSTLRSFLKGRKTFGESHQLKRLIDQNIDDHDLKSIKASGVELMVTVSNLTLNKIEFKRLSDHSFDDFRDFIWASSNFIPFMSLMTKNNYEYADGGFANLVPIQEAVHRGATIIDAIVLDTKVTQLNRLPSKNPFNLISNLFNFMQIHIEKYNISIGELAALQNNIQLNVYYTPTVLTTNTLIFDKYKMRQWWIDGYHYARQKHK